MINYSILYQVDLNYTSNTKAVTQMDPYSLSIIIYTVSALHSIVTILQMYAYI